MLNNNKYNLFSNNNNKLL